MARNTLADTAEHRPMRYCRTHQQAWVVPMKGAPHWYPLPWSRVQYALAWAKAGNCLTQITIVETPCPACGTATAEKSA
jgi:hypothetical protein